MTQTSDTGRSSRMPRWLKAVFALSLAANLAVVGLVAGAALRDDRSGRSRHKAPPPPAAAEAIGAVMYRSLDRDSRRVLRDLADGQYGNIVERRIAELNALLEVIRSEPLDVPVLRARIDAQTAAINEFREAMLEVWIAELQQMSPAERAAFADKVERHVARFRKPPPREGHKGGARD
ncbi:periplasmic heavy metal sensor [Tritonibacter scottomollicae]|uniref:Heavy-metal resistance protein n=1 Tax=Tritonibacter scottomollicae TaxID=483013 RepID=A0A2T1APN8_TRISK|nr:periplasmic heavy metal sensor [Tritonibacter scottomollicae]PRZ50477.1 heavy-metal resistance protein [Tritonibacter scottomollicae]